MTGDERMESSAEIRRWLDDRFRMTDGEGIYLAHQPIYGFRQGHSERDSISMYTRTYHIINALSHLTFTSLLDVGSAEGYVAFTVGRLLHAEVCCTDLSEQACDRATEIFGIRAVPADLKELPFSDGEFDVVLCSETLEHVADPRPGIDELLRVARRAVLITVPHESERTVKKNIRSGQTHSHISSFRIDSLRPWQKDGCRVLAVPIASVLLRRINWILDAMPQGEEMMSRYPELAINVYNKLVPVVRRLFGKRAVAKIISADGVLCRLFPLYHGILFIVHKEPGCYSPSAAVPVSPLEVMDISVPLHYLKEDVCSIRSSI
jgi:ubiquinone/menaquinone biosynthesis C-methylase UbiE